MNTTEQRKTIAKRLKKMLEYGVLNEGNTTFVRDLETLIDLTLTKETEDE